MLCLSATAPSHPAFSWVNWRCSSPSLAGVVLLGGGVGLRWQGLSENMHRALNTECPRRNAPPAGATVVTVIAAHCGITVWSLP